MIAQCSKCRVRAEVHDGAIGKKHRGCGSRAAGESKEHAGRWQLLPRKSEA